MRFSRHQIAEQKLIDLIPVANVILLLMFFFLLSWSFVLQPGIEVRLPILGLPVATPQGQHIITLKSSSKNDFIMFFDEKTVDTEGLKLQLRLASEKNFGEWMTLNAEDSIPHGRVQEVVSFMIDRGFRVTLAVQPAITKTIP